MSGDKINLVKATHQFTSDSVFQRNCSKLCLNFRVMILHSRRLRLS